MRRLCLALLGSLLCLPMAAVRAQSVPGTLPPPASAAPGSTQPFSPGSQPAATNPVVGEYLIYIDSTSQALLEVLQSSNPGSRFGTFEGRTVIEVAQASDAAQARTLLASLRSQGFLAIARGRTSGETISALDVLPFDFPQANITPLERRFWVVVPSLSQNFQSLNQQLLTQDLQGGAPQVKQLPLGAAVVVGPYSQVGTATSVQQTLSKAGIRTLRLYYGS